MQQQQSATRHPFALTSAQLLEAVQQDDLRLYYQRIVDSEQRTTGLEALLRWQHPSLGLLMPGHFIPLAEQTGLILPVGQWALEQACRQLAAWQHCHPQANWRIGVNVSAQQLESPRFFQHLYECLEESGAPPNRLCLELTESTLLTQVDASLLARLQQIRSLGIIMALDDFGTGYSSLSHLQTFNFDYLKIDRSFVCNLPSSYKDAAIVNALLRLASDLRMHVVAEGVETQEQFDYLREQGCTAFQGYLFGRPSDVSSLISDTATKARPTIKHA